MAVSFYKMFGYPTGVGALVARKSFLAKLHKPYFGGGTVEVVQCPGTIVHESSVQYERFEVRSPLITIGGVPNHVNRTAP
jgi:molybdenum cofactor sulfurtransferase